MSQPIDAELVTFFEAGVPEQEAIAARPPAPWQARVFREPLTEETAKNAAGSAIVSVFVGS